MIEAAHSTLARGERVARVRDDQFVEMLVVKAAYLTRGRDRDCGTHVA